MSDKERHFEIIEEIYEKYLDETLFSSDPTWLEPITVRDTKTGKITTGARQYAKKPFIEKCRTDDKFSEKWDLKIEDHELTLEERYNIWFNNNYETGMERYFDPQKLPDFGDPYYEPTPTMLFTLTHNNEVIKFYE